MNVASGHLFETVEIARCLVSRGHQVDVIVNDDADKGLKERVHNQQWCYYEYEKDVCTGFDRIREVLAAGHYNILATDLREVSNDWIHRIRAFFSGKIVCIDEWGHRRLDCDIIINPMIDPYYWDYGDSDAKLYAGHEYLALPEGILEYHDKEKFIEKDIKKVCISMGGVDRGGSTVRILKALLDEYPDIIWDVIIGASYGDIQGISALVCGYDNVRLSQNVSDIYERFYFADIAFCAGGNTLHELACIGTPAVIIPSVPHERNNGKMYEKKGFGICLDIACDAIDEDIRNSLVSLQLYERRLEMCQSGKLLSDGRGAERTVGILCGTDHAYQVN